MDVNPGKRCVGGNTAPTKGYSVTSKNAANERDHNTQFCNRIGCSGRIKYSQNTKFASSDKAKCSKPSCGNVISSKRPQLDSKRKLYSQSKFDPSESSVSSPSESSSVSPSGYQSNSRKNSGKVTLTGTGSSSSVSSNVRPRKISHTKPGPAVSISKTPASSNGKTVKYNSASKTSPDSKSLGKNVMKKRSPEGETSLSIRGRKSSYGISISEPGKSTCGSGDSNNNTWNRRSTTVNSRTRLSGSRQNGRNVSSVRQQPTNRNPDNERPFNNGGQSSSRQFSGNVYSSDSLSYSFSTNDDNPSGRMPFTFSVPSFSQLMNCSGIEEVLLALERIGQEELTYEQLFAVETRLFFSGPNLYDRHRDMRMDIDDMSYEDLLALEESIGTVSTALSEEALSKCVSKGIYQSTPSKVQINESGENGDDNKCSICQEEFVTGDEIGKLVECKHVYHETCINQWLRVKNSCPICKASAAQTE